MRRLKKMGHRLRRITLDWDFKNPLKVLFYINRVLKLLTNKQGEKLIIKRSRRGYHIFLWTRSLGNKFKVRKYLGDDKKHLAMDMLHRYGQQTLFNKKIKFRKRGYNKKIKK